MSRRQLKCSYTFKVVQGDLYKWEIEAFFYNFKEKIVERISSSPQTISREFKVPFGFIQSVRYENSNGLSITNNKGDIFDLYFDHLSPLLAEEDSKLKRMLIHFKEFGCEKVVDTLNNLLKCFHTDLNLVGHHDSDTESSPVIRGKRKEIVEATCDSSGYCSPVSELQRSSSLTTESVSLLEDTNTDVKDPNKGSCQPAGHVDNVLDTTHVSASDDEESLMDESISNKEDNLEGKLDGKLDINERIKDIIQNTDFLAVKFEDIIVPKELESDKYKVQELYDYLLNAPDKTKASLLGLVCKVDDDDKIIGKCECWVNVELFLALSRIRNENGGEYRALAVVHTLKENDIDSNILGRFLVVNSKNFDSKFAEKMRYQDLLRFTLGVVKDGDSETVIKFLKNSIRCFPKGIRNCNLFLRFTKFSRNYLNQLEKFIKLYEEGSLSGMKLSERKRCGIDRKQKRNNSSKLEVPIELLRQLANSHERDREDLTRSILNSNITYPEFKKKIEISSSLTDLKDTIVRMTNKNFTELQEMYRNQLDDDVLLQFVGAKTLKTGPNVPYVKLDQFVKNLMDIPVDEVQDTIMGTVNYMPVESLSLLDTGKKVKEANVIFIEALDKDDMKIFNKFEYSITEHVLSGKVVAVFAVSNDKLKNLVMSFDERTDIVVENVYIQCPAPKCEKGIKQVIVPLLLTGHSDLLMDSGVSNLYFLHLKEAIPKILNCFVKLGSNVLSIFSSTMGTFDVDKSCMMVRKGASVCYVSTAAKLDSIKEPS